MRNQRERRDYQRQTNNIQSDAEARKILNPSYKGTLHNVGGSSRTGKPQSMTRAIAASQSSITYTPESPESESEIESDPPPKRGFLGKWQFWSAMIVLFSGSVGFVAMALLLKLPAVPNCPSTFWPTASASMRLYCAQLAGNKQTEQDLLEAIQLVQDITPDHPLYEEVQRNLEFWVSDLLDLAEEKFHEGQLPEAIALAEDVRSKFKKDPRVIDERIKRWKSIWDQGEKIEAEVEQYVEKAAWGQAFQVAARLTKLDNRYWANTRYDQLHQRLSVARDESRKLDNAYSLLEKGGLDNILKAIDLAQEIPPRSSAQKEAQALIEKGGKQMIQLALEQMEKGEWQDAIAIANRIPNELGRSEEVKDINILADAASTATSGTMVNLEDAITIARKITPDRPLYNNAQNLIGRWQAEIEGVANLNRAEQFAQEGTVSGLNSAIAQAQLIPSSNPRYSQAQRRIKTWRSEIQTLQDGPYLNQAAESASRGDIPGYEEAIRQASQVQPSSPLASEAESNIQRWNGNLQETQDRPILDQAIAQANNGNYAEAISTAQRISPDSPLYGEVQGRMSRWEREQDAQKTLAQAYQTANNGTPEALRNAITTAQNISTGSNAATQRDQAINQWSYQLLSIARGRATSNVSEAIEIARQVPPNSSAYSEAQDQIARWQQGSNENE